MTIKKLFFKYKEVISYLFFGVLTTAVNIGTFALCNNYLKIDWGTSNIIAWIISVLFAYITNKLFVFEAKNTNILKEILSFVAFRLLSLGFDQASMYIMIDRMQIDSFIAKIIANVIVIILNYVFSKLFVFKKGSDMMETKKSETATSIALKKTGKGKLKNPVSKKISIIVPCYNEQESLPYFYEEMTKVMKQMKYASFELVFVNDGSRDTTLELLRNLAKKDKEHVRYISFSRNFGKEAAMYAGLEACTGDYVAIMDADLQDPPALLETMYQLVTEEGYDCVATRRVTRKGEPPIRSFFACCFYKLINKISNTDIVDGARDYRLMSRQMVDAILSMGEYNRFSKGIFGFVGFQTKWLEYENIERVAGQTKWNFWKLFIYALEGIIAFSTAPLVIASFIGILLCLIAFIIILVVIIKTLAFGDPVAGWPSLVCIIFFVSGIQLFCIGIIGQYLAKTYLEVKNRPIYIVKETEKDAK